MRGRDMEPVAEAQQVDAAIKITGRVWHELEWTV